METMQYLEVRSSANLVVLEKESIFSYPLEIKKRWEIGRYVPGNAKDIELKSMIVSRNHGTITCVDGKWYFTDSGSKNGTYYNGIKTGSKALQLKNGDILRIDSADIENPEERGVWMLFTTEAMGSKWNSIELNKENTIFGRDEDQCDVVFPFPYISGRHMGIKKYNDKHYVIDYDSKAGTWLNNIAVHGSKEIREKDLITICNCLLVFTGNKIIYNIPDNINGKITNEAYKKVFVSADIKSRKVPDKSGHGKKELIRDIKLEIEKGTLVALIGGAGAGKSTVMDCLNGRDCEGMEGTVEVNGTDLITNIERLKYLIGVVPQFDDLRDILTVEQEITHAAKHGLPNDIKKSEINDRVTATLQMLGIENVRKNKIGKCSGGERKRVNIGIELVADKQFLCMDEPDAGLDPGNKRRLFELLQRLAHEEGRTIITIIHDVSDIELFDKVIILNKVDNVGRLAFVGKPDEVKEYFNAEIKDVYAVMAKNPEKYIYRSL